MRYTRNGFENGLDFCGLYFGIQGVSGAAVRDGNMDVITVVNVGQYFY